MNRDSVILMNNLKIHWCWTEKIRHNFLSLCDRSAALTSDFCFILNRIWLSCFSQFFWSGVNFNLNASYNKCLTQSWNMYRISLTTFWQYWIYILFCNCCNSSSIELDDEDAMTCCIRHEKLHAHCWHLYSRLFITSITHSSLQQSDFTTAENMVNKASRLMLFKCCLKLITLFYSFTFILSHNWIQAVICWSRICWILTKSLWLTIMLASREMKDDTVMNEDLEELNSILSADKEIITK